MKINGYDTNGRKHGYWNTSSRNDNTTIEYYVHGNLDGPVQTLNRNCFLKKEEYYNNGKKHGIFRQWKWVNAPYIQTYYQDDKQVGIARTWEEVLYCEECEAEGCDCGNCCNSSRGISACSSYQFDESDKPTRFTIEKIFYVHDGKYEGLLQRFYEYQIQKQGNYENGLKEGKQLEWNIYSDDLKITTFHKGLKEGVYCAFEKDVVKECYYYNKDRMEGIIQNIYDDERGNVYDTTYKKQGINRTYDVYGDIKEIDYYVQGYMIGLRQKFEDRVLKSEWCNVFSNEMLDKYQSLSRSVHGVDYI